MAIYLSYQTKTILYTDLTRKSSKKSYFVILVQLVGAGHRPVLGENNRKNAIRLLPDQFHRFVCECTSLLEV